MPKIPAVVLLALLPVAFALPGAAAQSLDASLDASPHVEAPQGLPHVATPSGAAAAPGAVDDVLEMASLDAHASSGGAGLSAGTGPGDEPAEGDASRGEALSRAVMPVVEEHGTTAAAAVGVVALLQALGVWRVAGVGAFALYSRLTRSDLLDNTHRDRVYKLIQEEPGVGVSEIAKRTGLGWGTTVYHLDRLERAGFVAPEKGGLHKCFFPVGTVARGLRQGIGALKNDTTRDVARFLASRPGASQTEVCEATGLSASAASKQVSKLEKAGLVRRERDWRTVHLYPHDALHEALLTTQPAPMPEAPRQPGIVGPLAA